MTNVNASWERLDHVIRWANMNVNSFARHIGLLRAENLYQIKAGKNGISYRLAESIVSKFPEISKGWLLSGEGSMFSGFDEGIPFYESVVDMCNAQNSSSISFKIPILNECDAAFRNRDIAMSSLISSGEVVFVTQMDAKAIISGGLYVVTFADFVLLRRVRRNGKDLTLEAADKLYDDIKVSIEEVENVYSVVGSLKMY